MSDISCASSTNITLNGGDFPLSKNFFTTQREGYLRKSEDLEDEIFSEKETFSWLRENFWNIIPLIETFIPKDFT